MAVQVTQLRVYANLPTIEILPDDDVQIYIDIAAVIRSEDLEGKSITPGRLDLIELNLAAHYAIVSREYGGLTAQTVGQSEERYHIISDKMFGLGATRFGQQALALDTSGTLVTLASSPLKAKFTVVGDQGRNQWLEE